ncbi:hypothetical protein SDC9_154156 [bioreactor metagenome]|uniref:Uncharacterized protein n=1 Tax=bioreactor metagenome TaxID=1076179 RepID=A0A645F0D9_9ZZZZ
MRESLQPTQRIGIAVFRLEHDHSFQGIDKAALTRNPELGWEIRANAGNNFHGSTMIFFIRCHFFAPDFSKG